MTNPSQTDPTALQGPQNRTQRAVERVAGPQASVVCSLALVLIVELGLPRHKEC